MKLKTRWCHLKMFAGNRKRALMEIAEDLESEE